MKEKLTQGVIVMKNQIKWWKVIFVILLLLLLLLGGCIACVDHGDDWEPCEVYDPLPKPQKGKLQYLVNDGESINLTVTRIRRVDFKRYIESCKIYFPNNQKLSSNHNEFVAYAKTGEKLTLSFFDIGDYDKYEIKVVTKKLAEKEDKKENKETK